MKKLKLLSLFSLIVFFTLVYTSCTEDIELPPTITLLSGSSYIYSNAQVDPNANVTVNVKAEIGTGNLKLLTIFENDSLLALERISNGINGNPALLSSNDASGFEKEITFSTQNEGISDYKFVIEDVNGLKDSIGFTLTLNPVEPEETPLNFNADSIKVGNFKGPDPGSIDLQTGTAVSSDDASGDVQDIGWVDGSTDWAKKIKTKNGTKMAIPATALNWDDVTTLEALTEAFDAGTKKDVSDDISVGDLFLFKSPSATAGKYDYFIMNTLVVYESSGDNHDYFVFSLKGYKN